MTLLLAAIAWTAVLWLLLKILGPIIGQAILTMIERVEKKNAGRIDGIDGLAEALEVAKGRIIHYAEMDWTNERKREQSWKDVQATMSGRGKEIGETVALFALQMAYAELQKRGIIP